MIIIIIMKPTSNTAIFAQRIRHFKSYVFDVNRLCFCTIYSVVYTLRPPGGGKAHIALVCDPPSQKLQQAPGPNLRSCGVSLTVYFLLQRQVAF